MRRIQSVLFDGKAYKSLGYVVLRVPLGFVYVGIIVFVLGRTDTIALLLLTAPVGLAIFGTVLAERAMAKSWFGAQLSPMAPERAPGRTWQQRLTDFLSNPVVWKSLAFVAIEAIVGFVVGLATLIGFIAGVVGAAAGVIALLVVVLVALIGPASTIPPPMPFALVGLSLFSFGLLLLTLHGAKLAARVQVWFVRVMLGMSETHLALAAARAEAERERTRAEVADRSRRDLVLNVSHELRNPLATIRAHVDTLRGDGADQPSEEDRHRYLDVLNRETDRLSSLVDELLTLASADTGNLHLDVGPVNAVEVATQVHDAMAPLAWRERHIQLLCNTDEAPNVLADRGRLAQVLMNLVRNAITHTPEGGLVAIEVKPSATGPVEVSVSDTGPGISPDETDKIFERFYRTDASRTRATGGFGLGLAIAREMVDAMGGRISVASSPGQGSRFTVTLARA